jgi:hypothetical protein
VDRFPDNDSHGKSNCLFFMEKAARPQHGSLILVKTCLETEVGKAEFIIDSVLCI